MGSAIDVAVRLLNLFIAGTVSVEKFVAFKNQLDQIQAEGRDPSAEEWDAMIADAQTQGDQLDAADKTLNP